MYPTKQLYNQLYIPDDNVQHKKAPNSRALNAEHNEKIKPTGQDKVLAHIIEGYNREREIDGMKMRGFPTILHLDLL